MKGERAIQTPTEAHSSVSVLWILVWIVFGILAVGITYTDLRFLANYQVTDARVKKCEQEYDRGGQYRPECWYFTLHVEIEGIDYQIRKSSKRASFLKKQPKYDWARFDEKIITVYYCDELERATTFWDQTTKPNSFKLLFGIGSGESVLGLILLVVMSMTALISGVTFFVNSVVQTFKGFTIPRTSSGSFIYLKFCNDIVVPSISVALAVVFILFLGLLLIKGMLFVESKHTFFNGLFLVIGVVVATFGPGLIVKGIYYLKLANSEIIKAIQNLIIVAALGKLVMNVTVFFLRHDFHNQESIKELIIGTFSALIS